MAEEKKWLTNISEEDVEKLRRKTAYSLPDSPARAGMRASAVKPRFYEALTEGDVSLVAFLRRVILEANVALSLLDHSIGDNAQSLVDHKEDDEAHKELFDAVARSAAEAFDEHVESDDSHKELFDKKADADKGVIDDIIGEASENQRGLMSAEQFVQLATLVALLENDDADVTINTIKEVLKAFEGYDNGTLIANLLAEKLDKSHNTSDSAHSTLINSKIASHNSSGAAHTALFNSKVSKFTDTQVLYANNSAGDLRALKYTAALLGSTVPYRNSSNHTFRIGDPIDNDHPVTKGWLKNNVRNTIGNASTSQSGLMTAAQVSKLNRLVKLEELVEFMSGEEGDNELNTISELLKLIEDFPEGKSVVEMLATKVDKTEGDGVYATENGDEVKLGVSAVADGGGGMLALRNSSGGVTVPETPKNSNDAASKGYVDALWNALTYGEWGE